VPQLKTIFPPFATAATTASQLQLAGVPLPITVSGLLIFSKSASSGIGEFPSGFPARGPSSGFSKGLFTITALFVMLSVEQLDANKINKKLKASLIGR